MMRLEEQGGRECAGERVARVSLFLSLSLSLSLSLTVRPCHRGDGPGASADVHDVRGLREGRACEESA